MKRTSLILVSVAAIALLLAAWWRDARDARTSVAASAPVGQASIEAAPSMVAIAPAQAAIEGGENAGQIALAIERALAAPDPRQRETAFAFLLPRLIELNSARVVAMVARQDPGEVRDALRDEVARLWIVRDHDAAIGWMGSLEIEAERRAAATIAVRTLAASSPAAAIDVADQFGVGRDDGSLEHLVQIWATEKPDEAMRWIDSQPAADPRTAQLRARIDQVRAQDGVTSR